MTTRVCICVPTFRRPSGLRRVLSELPGLSGDFDIHVVVADNDAERAEGLAVCRDMLAAGYPLELTAVVSPERGVAQTRNLLVATSLADADAALVAMIDDDSWPAPDWLEILCALLSETGADMAGSQIDHAYETPPEPGVEALNAAFRRRTPSEGRLPILYNTCGLVARRSVFERISSPWFQPEYGLSGGEDDDFFLRTSAENMTFAFSPRAVVTEFVPTTRATRSFLNRRAFAQGTSWTNIRRKRRPPGWSYAGELGKILGGFAVGVAAYMAMFWSPRHRVAAEYRIRRAAGKVNGLLGHLVEPYKAAHGE